MTQRLSSKLMLLGGEPTHWCPGCKGLHRFAVNAPNSSNGARWTWNNDAVNPSFAPSMDIDRGTDHQCHYYITEGRITFCADSKHELAGLTMPLPDIPEDWQ